MTGTRTAHKRTKDYERHSHFFPRALLRSGAGNRLLGNAAGTVCSILADKHDAIGDIRGGGFFKAVELVKDRETREPATELTAKVLTRSLEKGLVVISCGVYGNAIRVLVPLTASVSIIDQGLDIIESSMLEVLDDI